MDIKECTYGSKCYRRNKQHFLGFSHPYIENVASRINNGEIEAVMSLGLTSDLVEQAQVVAELMESGELIPKGQQIPETSVNNKMRGVKRNASEMMQTKASQDAEVTHLEHKEKQLKLTPSVDKNTSATIESLKAQTSAGRELNPQQKVEASAPIHYFLSAVANEPETWDQPLTLRFTDLFHPSLGVLQQSMQMNFMVELGWLLAQYCQHKVQRKPLLVIYGAESEELSEAKSRVPTINTIRVKPKYPFGSHHTKMSALSYEDGSLRIVVHTGNLIESDWEDRTQGIWVSPSCPPLLSKAGENTGDGDSVTGFKRDLLRYLETYSLVALKPWIEKIQQADMSHINVCFIPSSPGSHPIHPGANERVPKWGHLHLSWLLQQHSSSEPDDTVIMQCSSIGSLGPSPSSWLVGELAVSMAASSGMAKLGQQTVQVVYPCAQDVKASIHGMAGGGCLPYTRQGHNKQTWLTGFLHKWRSESRLRTRAMPHIKSYARISSDMARASFFLLTSGNLSKAAWGMRTNKGATIMIQSFEAGVLFLPKFVFGGSSFELGKQLPLPYDLPLTKYGDRDEPWFIDNMR
ncbi:probable tyrosyl-DNA phosphodiesterase [Daphnia carinata]|uniref:probable tyrosyl-DNA phosphodiesterase n=1 Tax=Daphnia carinata TaxID=120202 RepID=UPI00257B81CC|nr:probable tyrosyl-DNA phosphodiesterase [Daphnia carinata]